MKGQKAVLHMRALVRKWIQGEIDTLSFVAEYWQLRRSLMDAGELLAGDVGSVMSTIDTAVDSFSPEPDPHFHEIDEAELRCELTRALESLEALGAFVR
ncbi:MAG: hypothetical protein ACR2PL_03340 [Dehalococcoidia bacterium]